MKNEYSVTTNDGVRLHVCVKGRGERTVIVPNAVYMEDAFDSLLAEYTFVYFDLRNRGRSDATRDREQVARGIHHDVEDLEIVRQHFQLEQFDLIGWSYLGLMVMLYAMRFPTHVRRVVQLSPMQPNIATQYASHLTNDDATRREVMTFFAQVQGKPLSSDPIENCKQVWATLRRMYVANEDDVAKISQWGFCDVENERNQAKHFIGNIMPTVAALNLQEADFAKATMPVLVIHGKQDRSAPYGGGRDWAMRLPNARLLSLDNVGHVPWIESPAKTLDSIDTFLRGGWPLNIDKVQSV